MRILIDENLPRDLLGLVESGAGVHATELGFRQTDLQLWEYARAHGLVILTRDTDFFDRMLMEGPPPQVIWIRWGNLRRTELEAALFGQWAKVVGALKQADLVELHSGGRIEAMRFS